MQPPENGRRMLWSGNIAKIDEKQFLEENKFPRINVILPESLSLSMYC